SSRQGLRGEPLASRGQLDRHFPAPARARRQTRQDRARGVPARDRPRNRIRHDFARTTRRGRRGGAQARPRAARMIEVKGDAGYGHAFGAMEDARGQPIILPAGPMFFRDRAAIAQALLDRRIPSIAAFRENAEAGALISYGFDLMGLFYDIAS